MYVCMYVSGSYIHLSLSGLGETNQKHWSLPFDIIQYLQSVFVFRFIISKFIISKYKPCCKNSNFVFFSADFAFCKLWLKASASSFLILFIILYYNFRMFCNSSFLWVFFFSQIFSPRVYAVLGLVWALHGNANSHFFSRHWSSYFFRDQAAPLDSLRS